MELGVEGLQNRELGPAGLHCRAGSAPAGARPESRPPLGCTSSSSAVGSRSSNSRPAHTSEEGRCPDSRGRGCGPRVPCTRTPGSGARSRGVLIAALRRSVGTHTYHQREPWGNGCGTEADGKHQASEEGRQPKGVTDSRPHLGQTPTTKAP